MRATVGVDQAILGSVPERAIADAVVGGGALANRHATAVTESAEDIVRIDLASDARRESIRLSDLRHLPACASPMNGRRQPFDGPGCRITLIDPHRLVRRACRHKKASTRPLDSLRLQPGFLFVFRVTISDASGRDVETRLLPLCLPWRGSERPRSRLDARRVVMGSLWPIPDPLARVVGEIVADRVVALGHDRAAMILRATHREGLLLREAERALARPLVQPGLFDGRAVRAADRAATEASQRWHDLEGRQRQLKDAAHVEAADPEPVLIAVIPEI